MDGGGRQATNYCAVLIHSNTHTLAPTLTRTLALKSRIKGVVVVIAIRSFV